MTRYDLKAARAQIKTILDGEAKQRADMLANPPKDVVIDADFLRAQAMFADLRMEFTLTGMKAENLGVGRIPALGAAAKALGDMLSTLTLSCISGTERQIVKMCFDRALAEGLMPPAPDDGRAAAAMTPVPEETRH